VDPAGPRVVPLDGAAAVGAAAVGNKAVHLARLRGAGFLVPDGICVTASAYDEHVRTNGLRMRLEMELGRKSLDSSRWEEIWDAAHRIRAAFLAGRIPGDLEREILEAARPFSGRPLAVRSSAPGEDSASRSHAGLHDSVTHVRGRTRLLVAVRAVWASLWSDAALIYRRELGLDPRTSRMAVVVQPMAEGGPSGVAFGRDPREPAADRAIVEAVPGGCGELVDGSTDPDRWILRASTGEVLEWRPGGEGGTSEPLLDDSRLGNVRDSLARVRRLLGEPPDLEWTFGEGRLTLLQARPITAPAPPDDEREWYLSLTPGDGRLRRLARRVADERIPELAAEGDRLAGVDLAALDGEALAEEIDGRRRKLSRWRAIYRDEFIPLAHGVRRLASFYEEAVGPSDPYEFVGLLTGQELLAFRRNEALAALADRLREDERLREAVRGIVDGGRGTEALAGIAGGPELRAGLDDLLGSVMDVEWGGERLGGRPDLLLHLVLELADRPERAPPGSRADELLGRLLDAVGPEREAEAREVVETARLSWRLRDDDNLLLGRVESQLLRAVADGARRLADAGRLPEGATPGEEAAEAVAAALRSPEGGRVVLPPAPGPSAGAARVEPGVRPRQLVGQPSSPGIAVGPVRRIREVGDMARFRAGDVLVCPAIQPSITHLVPLASAVVERRGGMLIHGAIIARELGIPCVNGIPGVVDLLEDGERVTVDGWLGIVTVGEPELDLETAGP